MAGRVAGEVRMLSWRRLIITIGGLLLAANSFYAPRLRLSDGSPLSREFLISNEFDKHDFKRFTANSTSFQPAGVNAALWAVWSTMIVALTVAAAAAVPSGSPSTISQ